MTRIPLVALLLALSSACAPAMRAVEADSLLLRARLADERGDYAAAAATYRASLALMPSSAAANNLGVLSARRSDLAGAARWFARAIAIDDTSVIARTNSGVVLVHLGRAGEAVDALLGARRQRQLNIDNSGGTGRIDWTAEQYAAATARCDQVAARYLDRLAGSADLRAPSDGRGDLLASLTPIPNM